MEGAADGTLEGDAMSASRSQSSGIGGCVWGGERSTIRTAMDTQNRQMHADTRRCRDAAKNHRCTFRWIDCDRDTETETQR